MILEELNNISNLITEIIRSDDFPEKIEPLQLREAVLSYPLRAGKRLRPALVVWSCGLLDGDIKQAEYAAAAVEVYHNWTLVHDDIIDQDDVRRGKPATHTELKNFAKKNYSSQNAEKFGTDFGILAGDLQHAWAMNLLLKSIHKGVPSGIVANLARDLCEKLSRELISGEALDVEFSYKDIKDVSPEEVEKMMYLKTGALLNFSVTTGAKIALNTDNSKDKRIQKLVEFATAVGIAFQLRDDWLGIFGDAEAFGKPLGTDICSAKPTLLLQTSLKYLKGDDKAKLLNFLGASRISKKELEIIRSLMRKSGAEKEILDKTHYLQHQAEKSLSVFPDNEYRKLLLDLNNYLLTRNK